MSGSGHFTRLRSARRARVFAIEHASGLLFSLLSKTGTGVSLRDISGERKKNMRATAKFVAAGFVGDCPVSV